MLRGREVDVLDGQETFFDERFLGRHAGLIMSDPTTALIELVANAWDAYATRVEIDWPNPATGALFAIRDNGAGMTAAELERRWRTIDYNRVAHQGATVDPPPSVIGPPRAVYGRNGRGRHAAFHFSSPYRIVTRKDGREVAFQVSQGTTHPIQLERISSREGAEGHGTEILATESRPSRLNAADVRAILSTRFLANPAFEVSVDGVRVTFEDVPSHAIRTIMVEVPGHGTAKILAIDSQRADRTTRQHGIAWWVNGRLVGQWGWRLSDEARVLDGRSEEAKRFTFIVQADFLADAVKEDWSDFRDGDDTWAATERLVQAEIRNIIHTTTTEKRKRTREAVRASHRDEVARMPPLSRERWNGMLDEVADNCPSISEAQLSQVMGILAKLELAQSQYSLLDKLHRLAPDDYDNLDQLLSEWSISTAKIALDEISRRLRLVEEIRAKTADTRTQEVQELQPLFKNALWIFGPEFESIEFTSNRGMTQVIRTIFHAKAKGSLARPDFVITPHGSVGLYAIPSYDAEHNEDGVSSLVIVDLKRPGVALGSEEKTQIWNYVKELRARGHLRTTTPVTGYILGDRIEDGENEEQKQGPHVAIRPMLYSTFVLRAEKRMLRLRERLLDAPFLKEAIASFSAPEPEPPSQQASLSLAVAATAAAAHAP